MSSTVFPRNLDQPSPLLAVAVVAFRVAPHRRCIAGCAVRCKSWGTARKVPRAPHPSEATGAFACDSTVDNEAPVPLGAVGAMPPALQQRASCRTLRISPAYELQLVLEGCGRDVGEHGATDSRRHAVADGIGLHRIHTALSSVSVRQHFARRPAPLSRVMRSHAN
jgi:hypothetical protein